MKKFLEEMINIINEYKEENWIDVLFNNNFGEFLYIETVNIDFKRSIVFYFGGNLWGDDYKSHLSFRIRDLAKQRNLEWAMIGHGVKNYSFIQFKGDSLDISDLIYITLSKYDHVLGKGLLEWKSKPRGFMK